MPKFPHALAAAFTIGVQTFALSGSLLEAQEFDRVEPGTRVRVGIGPPPPTMIEGRFWESRDDGLLLARRQRPEFFPWDRIESFEYWRPDSAKRWGSVYGALIGAAVLGYTARNLDTDDNGEVGAAGLAIGVAVGGILGWAIGHGVSGDNGDWRIIPVREVRALHERPR